MMDITYQEINVLKDKYQIVPNTNLEMFVKNVKKDTGLLVC